MFGLCLDGAAEKIAEVLELAASWTWLPYQHAWLSKSHKAGNRRERRHEKSQK
jgi:hypothetical protein